MKKSIDEIEKKIEYLKEKKKKLTQKKNLLAGITFYKTFPEMLNATDEELKAFMKKLEELNHESIRENR